jgi:DNA-directed RNA polymerase I subunit RPA2
MLLKGLKNVSDYEIFRCVMRHRENNSFIEGNIKFSLRQLQDNKDEVLLTQNDILKYIGSRFRVKLQLPEWYTDIECAQYLFKYHLLTHLSEDSDKFNFLM